MRLSQEGARHDGHWRAGDIQLVPRERSQSARGFQLAKERGPIHPGQGGSDHLGRLGRIGEIEHEDAYKLLLRRIAVGVEQRQRDAEQRSLVSLRVAQMVGCPF
ncbi:MAG TPA: hypothetical protein VF120_17125 [Ktedonobacterales bacterium]